MRVSLFIDANQYLELYGLNTAKTLLDLLEQLKEHLFISEKIVDEVLMSKVERFQTFFSNRLKEIPHMDSPVPGHLFGITEKETTELKDCFVRAKEARNRLRKLAGDTLLRISRSEDDVSLRLSGLFDSAISPSTEEMQRARERKEKGNPPGKARDPLGDQITWEQFLTHCQQRKIERAWIILHESGQGLPAKSATC